MLSNIPDVCLPCSDLCFVCMLYGCTVDDVGIVTNDLIRKGKPAIYGVKKKKRNNLNRRLPFVSVCFSSYLIFVFF